MALINQLGGDVTLACELYRQYFQMQSLVESMRGG